MRRRVRAGDLAIVGAALGVWLAAQHTPEGTPQAHLAYIGPGAGFAFLGSFLALLSGFLASVLSLITWPFRMVRRAARRRRGFRKARIRKLIFLGLDGLDPRLVERFLADGKLPNFARLQQQGSFRRLRTTYPALSPVAWSTFATGVSPARHNIFDFLNRNLRSYRPELSSSKVQPPRRTWKLFRYRIPLSRPHVELRRKSTPFWTILAEQDIDCTILRVPITFPPERFRGRLLSAMCTPDLLGTQGSFSFFTTRPDQAPAENGVRRKLAQSGDHFLGFIEGPPNLLVADAGSMRIPFTLVPDKDSGSATLRINGTSYRLKRGEYSPWAPLAFRAGLGIKVRGICRFLLTESHPHCSLYVSPINIDPEHPALPISEPAYYAAYLAKLLGTFATLGMAEDTWALNERAIDEEAFLQQAYLTHAEREAMFFSALERTRSGVVACVFDATDRVQHMFYRYLESPDSGEKYSRTIENLYARMDDLVGRALRFVDENTVLFVLSDHGFRSFRRGVNLNSWLHQNGFLALEDGRMEGGRYLAGVDWSRTRAYTFGLAGLYLNQRGREAQGIVAPGQESEDLKRELAERLSGLRDENGEVAIRQVYPADSLYRGPYLEAAPDLIVGYNDGYRSSWDAAVGKTTTRVFEDNHKAWSGDHCVDPCLVPGVLFCNRQVQPDSPGIEDLAPTALALFGLEVPSYMEGKPLFEFAEARRAA